MYPLSSYSLGFINDRPAVVFFSVHVREKTTRYPTVVVHRCNEQQGDQNLEQRGKTTDLTETSWREARRANLANRVEEVCENNDYGEDGGLDGFVVVAVDGHDKHPAVDAVQNDHGTQEDHLTNPKWHRNIHPLLEVQACF